MQFNRFAPSAQKTFGNRRQRGDRRTRLAALRDRAARDAPGVVCNIAVRRRCAIADGYGDQSLEGKWALRSTTAGITESEVSGGRSGRGTILALTAQALSRWMMMRPVISGSSIQRPARTRNLPPTRTARSSPLPGSDAYGKIDLLTVLLHEQGHALGLVDLFGDSDNVMLDSVVPGGALAAVLQERPMARSPVRSPVPSI